MPRASSRAHDAGPASDAASVAAAVASAREYLDAHPDKAVGTDAAARASLGPSLTTVVEGPNGWRIQTGMAPAIGGDGSAPSPGWVMRAALASCDIVLIAMQAAEDGISIRSLTSEVVTESDDRGLLGIGNVPAGPLRVKTTIHLEADALDSAASAALVERALRRSPVADALRRAMPVDVELGD